MKTKGLLLVDRNILADRIDKMNVPIKSTIGLEEKNYSTIQPKDYSNYY